MLHWWSFYCVGCWLVLAFLGLWLLFLNIYATISLKSFWSFSLLANSSHLANSYSLLISSWSFLGVSLPFDWFMGSPRSFCRTSTSSYLGLWCVRLGWDGWAIYPKSCDKRLIFSCRDDEEVAPSLVIGLDDDAWGAYVRANGLDWTTLVDIEIFESWACCLMEDYGLFRLRPFNKSLKLVAFSPSIYCVSYHSISTTIP